MESLRRYEPTLGCRPRQPMNKRGFTLIELMIVVAIIGVLASLAIYGVAQYLKRAKSAEATRSLGAIENGARQQYQKETPYGGDDLEFVHRFCDAAPLTPATVPVARKITVPATSWNHVGWACLKFSLVDPQYYSYKHETNSGTGTAATYTASAIGDLDGNGKTSLFELTGHGGPYGDAVRDTFRAIDVDE
jgi:type IV pilus assembly protein PilA